VAFLFSNLTAYIINITWVFSPGRHHPMLEFLFFFGVSGIAILIGSTLMGFLIHTYGTTTTTAFLANILVSLMINFFIRKHVIFKD
jgi:putative flippase GtrA